VAPVIERLDGEVRRLRHIAKRRGKKIATIAIARKLLTRSYWQIALLGL
jgi:hypothetical protein